MKNMLYGLMIFGCVSSAVNGMLCRSASCKILDKTDDLKKCKTQRSFSLPTTRDEIQSAVARLTEPTPDTREKLKKYCDFFVENDKYPMPSKLWNWSVESDNNMGKALEVGRIINSSSLQGQHDVKFDEFDGFFVDDDIKATSVAKEFVEYFGSNRGTLEYSCVCVGMRNLYQIADDLYIDEAVRKVAWDLYELTYSQMLDIARP